MASVPSTTGPVGRPNPFGSTPDLGFLMGQGRTPPISPAQRHQLNLTARGPATSQREADKAAAARRSLAGPQPPSFGDQMTMAGFSDFFRSEAAEKERAGAVGGVADQMEGLLGSFGEDIESGAAASRERLGGDAERLQRLGAEQVGDFKKQSADVFGNVQERVDAALKDFEKTSYADISSTAFAASRAAEQQIKEIQADPNIPDSVKQQYVNRATSDMQANRQMVVSKMMEGLRTNLFAGRMQGASLIGQVGTTLTGQLLESQRTQLGFEQTAADIIKFGETLELNAKMQAAELRLRGLSELANLRERAVASPSSLFALYGAIGQAQSSPTVRGRTGINTGEVTRRLGV